MNLKRDTFNFYKNVKIIIKNRIEYLLIKNNILIFEILFNLVIEESKYNVNT